MPTLYTVIRRPLITEKGMTVKETQNTLVFEVDLKATKTEVKQAVESLFKVKVTGVRTTTIEGKERRRGNAGGKDPFHSVVTTLAGKISFGKKPFVEANPCSFQSQTVPLESSLRRVVDERRVTDVSNAPVPQGDQVIGSVAAGLAILCSDRILLRVSGGSEHDQRKF